MSRNLVRRSKTDKLYKKANKAREEYEAENARLDQYYQGYLQHQHQFNLLGHLTHEQQELRTQNEQQWRTTISSQETRVQNKRNKYDAAAAKYQNHIDTVGY